MKQTSEFTPLSIDDCDGYRVAEYGYYCDEKVKMDEMPLSIEDWQILNNEPGV